jgi:hypothetical protein
MSNPQIIYTQSDGSEVTLAFTYPPSQVPAYHKIATRHDNISSCGVRESVLERLDEFLEFTVYPIQGGVECENWQAFLDTALSGGLISFYPDASLPAFTNYLLEDTESTLEYKAPGIYALALKLRRAVGS